MNILVITPFYKHDKNIASVRWTNISTRLAKKHKVIVVTQPHDDMDMNSEIFTDDDGILVARLNQKTAYEKFAVKYFGGATGDDWQTSSSGAGATVQKDGFVRKLKNIVLMESMKSKSRAYARDIMKNVIPKDTKIDVVISSACPFIEMMFGYELSKKLKCKWIADFRDLPFNDDKPHNSQLMKRIMQKQLDFANTITVVVPNMVERLNTMLGISKDKIQVLSNGFSKKDYVDDNLSYDDKILHLGFTGTLYSNGSECNMLFETLKECLNENSEFKFVIDCAGGNSGLIKKTATKFMLDEYVVDNGFVSRVEALSLQRKSDCLIVFTDVSKGGFAAKIFEYMLCKKPIVNIVYGSMRGSDSQKFIEELNLGIAVEEAIKHKDIDRLKEYFLMQFERKVNGQNMLYEPIMDKVNMYDHDHICQQVETLIN